MTATLKGVLLVVSLQQFEDGYRRKHHRGIFIMNRQLGGFRSACAAILAMAGVLHGTARAELEKGNCAVERQTDVSATMRDGTKLMADIYRPKDPGTYPVILMRLPYNKDAAQTYVYAPPQDYASHCYIVVIQDVRGQYKSGGEYYPFRDEGADGYDTIEWAAALPGSSGKVGMYGFSYVGATQWLAAVQRPPHLAAIVPAQTSSDYYDGWSYEGGAFSLAFEESWPLTTIALSPCAASAIKRCWTRSAVRQQNCLMFIGTCRLRTILVLPSWDRGSRPTTSTGWLMIPGTPIGSDGALGRDTKMCRFPP